MDKRRASHIFALLGILIFLAVILFARGTARRSGGITLPNPNQLQDSDQQQPGNERLQLVEIRPDTVQRAVESMERAAFYSMTVRVETLWSGGSGAADLTTYVRGGVTRVDELQLDGAVRHTLTDGKTVYVWYDSEENFSVYPAGATIGDYELRIPTYEDLVELDTAAIMTADYRALQDLYCIFVEANEGDNYTARYWIDVESGLLVAAQRLHHGEPIYQMTVQSLHVGEPPEEEFFQLPDTTSLLPEISELAFSAEE